VLSCGWGEDFELARRKRRAAPTELTVFFVAMRLGEDLGWNEGVDKDSNAYKDADNGLTAAQMATGLPGIVKAAGKAAIKKGFSKSVRNLAKRLNREKNGGVLKSEKSGDELLPRNNKSEKGVTPPDNESHVDHKIPKSKGGDNSIDNAQILSRKENLAKGNQCEIK
jgi:hypothetical protein